VGANLLAVDETSMEIGSRSKGRWIKHRKTLSERCPFGRVTASSQHERQLWCRITGFGLGGYCKCERH
jgi:hypothetical protein